MHTNTCAEALIHVAVQTRTDKHGTPLHIQPLLHTPSHAAQRILPLHQADAGPAYGVVEFEAEQSPGRPAVGVTALLLAFGILLPLLLR